MYKMKKSFILILTASFAFALFSGGNLPYSLFYMMLFIGVISILYSVHVMKNLSVDEVIEKRNLIAGEETEDTIRIYNDSVLSISYLEIESELLGKILPSYRGDVSSVKRNSTRYIKRTVRFNVRGIYGVGVTYFKLSDPFGIISGKGSYRNCSEVMVYPRMYPINIPDILGGCGTARRELSAAGRRQLLLDGSETIKNIREYQTGDNYKRINWRISAKHGKLYVKEYENNESPKVNLFLDFRKEAYRRDEHGEEEEKTVEFFLSLSYYVLKKYRETMAYAACDEEKAFLCASVSVIEEMKDYFLRHYSSGLGSISNYMEGYMENVSLHSAVVIVTNEIKRDSLDYFLKLAGEGYKVTAFYNGSYTGSLTRDDICDAEARGVVLRPMEEIC